LILSVFLAKDLSCGGKGGSRHFPMDGALPLGTIAGADFSISHFQIGKGDTFCSEQPYPG
jgi:hypothetical protein